MDSGKLKKVAKLARILVLPEDEEKVLNMLNADINTIKSMDNINTDGLEPMVNPYDMKLRTYDDVVSDGDKQDELMKCSQKSMYNYFTVPKVMEN